MEEPRETLCSSASDHEKCWTEKDLRTPAMKLGVDGERLFTLSFAFSRLSWKGHNRNNHAFYICDGKTVIHGNQRIIPILSQT